MKPLKHTQAPPSASMYTTYLGAGLLKTFIVVRISEDPNGLALCSTVVFLSELPNVGRTEVRRSPKELNTTLVALTQGVYSTKRNKCDGAETDGPTQ